MKKSKNTIPAISRRKFIGTSVTVGAGLALSPSIVGSPAILRHRKHGLSLINGVNIGVITYSFRSMPDQSAEATLRYVLDSGIGDIELMGDPAESFAGIPERPFDMRTYWTAFGRRNEDEMTDDQKKEREEAKSQVTAYMKEVAEWRAKVSMDKFEQMGKMYKEKGVNIYAFKPSAFGKNNTNAEINYGFRAAKALGANHVTLEHPGDNAHTQKLGDMAKKHNIYVAYHGHEQQTPTLWDTALEQSEYNAMNLDLGHYVAAGNPSPLDLIRAKHDRIRSMHVKDRTTPENGKKNLPFGEGDTPIVEVLQLMRDQKYTFPATIELEYRVPENSDPVKEVRKCLEYCRQALG